VFIAPRVWQHAMFGYVAKGQTKVASVAKTLEKFGLVVSPDTSDAILLGSYYLQYGLTMSHKSTKLEINGKRRSPKFATKAQQPEPATRALPTAKRARPRKRVGSGGAVGT
jgi:hypothetical protein